MKVLLELLSALTATILVTVVVCILYWANDLLPFLRKEDEDE